MKIPTLETYFASALERKMLMYEVEMRYGGEFLAVYYRENLGYVPKEDGSKWSLVCAQSLLDYKDSEGNIIEHKLIDRITLMLTERLRSSQQDVNGLMNEQSSGYRLQKRLNNA